MLALLAWSPAWAETAAISQVSQVSADNTQLLISHDPAHPWFPGDPVIIRREGATLGMGLVDSVNEAAALISVKRLGSVPAQAGDEAAYGVATAQIVELAAAAGELWVTHPLGSVWNREDSICVERAGLTLGCGYVVETGADRARVQLKAMVVQPVVGDYLRAAFVETVVLSVDGSKAKLRQLALSRWTKGESACLQGQGEKKACGTISESEPASASLTLSGAAEAWKPGAAVRGEPHTSFVYQVTADQKSMTVTQSEGGPWRTKDGVCVQRLGLEFVCGRVGETNEQTAQVTFDGKPKEPIVAGESVRRAGENLKAGTAPRDPKSEAKPPGAVTSLENHGISFGFVINYAFPGIHYQRGITEHLSLGINLLVLNHLIGPSTSIMGAGTLVSLNYYRQALYQGLWVQFAAGPYGLKASNGGSEKDFKLLGSILQVGWRWKWGLDGNFGFGVGVHYLLKFPDTFGNQFNGLMPSLSMEIGFAL